MIYPGFVATGTRENAAGRDGKPVKLSPVKEGEVGALVLDVNREKRRLSLGVRWLVQSARKRNGKIQPTIGSKWRILANIFANPDLPEIDDYYEPFDFDYGHLQTAPEMKHFPTARPRSCVTAVTPHGPPRRPRARLEPRSAAAGGPAGSSPGRRGSRAR